MTPMLQTILSLQEHFSPENAIRDAAREKQKVLRDKMQVAESLKATASNGFEREIIGQLLDEYQCQLDTARWDERFPKPRPVTDGDDPAYWREKREEMKREGEGMDRHDVDEAI